MVTTAGLPARDAGGCRDGTPARLALGAAPRPSLLPPAGSPWLLLPILLVWSAVWVLARRGRLLVSWHYVATGSALLLSPAPGGGVHLYASHPYLQMGPLTFLIGALFTPLGPVWGPRVALVLMTATGPVLLALLAGGPARAGRLTGRKLLVAGALVIPVWVDLAAGYGHLDDVLALACSVGAVRATAAERHLLAASLLALAADAKPWAAPFAVLLLHFDGPRRRSALLLWGAGVAAAWLPFLVGDPGTLAVTRFTIVNATSSALRALGADTATTPWWDRPTQILLGAAIAGVAVRRGRWPGVLAAAIAVRIALDPSVYTYYTAGLLLGCLAVDLALTRWSVPVTTTVAFLGLVAVRHVPGLDLAAHSLGLIRLGVVAVVVAAALLHPRLQLTGGTRSMLPMPDRGLLTRAPR